jgi:Protein of unknown function (DUF2752)
MRGSREQPLGSSRSPSALRRHRHLLAGLALGLGAGALVLLYESPPTAGSLYPGCIFHQCTGLYCPGCGATRATYELLHGNLAGAFGYNPLYVATLPLITWWLFRTTADLITVRARPQRRHQRTIRWALVSVIICFGIARNLPFKPFRWMAPHDPQGRQSARVDSPPLTQV